MISLSKLQEYMFCPLKLYLENELDDSEDDSMKRNILIKNLRIDLHDLTQRNLRRIDKDMKKENIKDILFTDTNEIVDKGIKNLKNEMDEEELENFGIELEKQVSFHVELTAIKCERAMDVLNCDGVQVSEIFNPPSMYNYMIRDKHLELVGKIDKVEVIEGRYYPVDIKLNTPPIKGVWDSDALKLVASAMLIESEFDTDVFIGFIDYISIGERRPVLMDSKLRKSLFSILKEVKKIVYDDKIPEARISSKKCVNCEYIEICQDIDKDLI
ncbi:MAG: CRISPR-associated protein Cas4 [Methanobacteriaceae archaeon]